jgi:hypothetical protein
MINSKLGNIDIVAYCFLETFVSSVEYIFKRLIIKMCSLQEIRMCAVVCPDQCPDGPETMK